MVYPAEGTAGFVVLLSIATALPALGVSAALGGISFSLAQRAAPKGLPRRAEVLLLVVSLVVPVLLLPTLWSSISGFVEGRGALGAYVLGAGLPFGALALALLGGPGASSAASSRRAVFLAFVSCGLYAAPVFLCGYVLWGAGGR